jgi:hypothetical protein
LQALKNRGHFSRPIFPEMAHIDEDTVAKLLQRIQASQTRFDTFNDARNNEVGYSFSNEYFSSPDAEILYSVIQEFRPRRIIEVGSGNSTRIARQAIRDATLTTDLISIDPFPRCDVSAFVDRVIAEKVETINDSSIFESLACNDILFIDSSHQSCVAMMLCFFF